MKKKLLVVVLMWNDYKNTEKCIKCCLKHSKKYDIYYLLIDNNSSDGSYKKLINKYNFLEIKNKKFIKLPQKKISIKNNINLGCGAGHNPGYQFGIKNDFEYIARIDNDMLFRNKFFNENIELLDKNRNINAISPKILYQNKKKIIWWKGTKIGKNLKFQSYMRDYPYNLKDSYKFTGTVETDAIAGCASIMRVSRIKKIGLSDKEFFYGPEDIEFSRRIYEKKGSLMVNLYSKIYHKIAESFKNKLMDRRLYFHTKYNLLLLKKIGTKSDKLFGYTISIIKLMIYIFLLFSKKQRNKIIPVIKAYRDFFIFNRFAKYDLKNNNK
jgi:GT2 family glycosyltransferase